MWYGQFKNKSQKGFLVPILIIIVAVLAVGGSIYYYSQKGQFQKQTDIPIQKNQKNDQNPSISQTNNNNVGTTSNQEKLVTKSPELSKQNSGKTVFVYDVNQVPEDESAFVFIQSDTKHPIDPLTIKINGLTDFKPLTYEAPFTLSWSVPQAKSCSVLASNPVSGTNYQQFSFQGSENIYATQSGNYTSRLKVNILCNASKNDVSQNISITIGIPILTPKITGFTFITPKQGDTLDSSQKSSITWNYSKSVSSVFASMYRASDNHEVDPALTGLTGLIGVNISSLSFNSNFIPTGKYYIKITKINNIISDIKSGTFDIIYTIPPKPADMSDQDYKTYMATLEKQNLIHTAYLEQNASMCNSFAADTLYQCYNGVAVASRNVSVCENIPASASSYEYTRNACMFRIANITNSPSMCEKIINDANHNVNNCKSMVRVGNSLEL